MKTFRSTMLCFPFWLLLSAGSFLADFTTPTPSIDSAPAQKTDPNEGAKRTPIQPSGRGCLLWTYCTIDPRYNTCIPGTIVCSA